MASCTIVIPVYNAFAETQACLHSVLAHTPPDVRILVIDDASPAGNLQDFLPRDVLADPRLHLVRNAANLGFVRTCNWGMQWAGRDDVLLLNSDTEVTAGWLGKLQAAAASSPRVGTVTPFTNNGEICSLPRFMHNNELPQGYTLESFAQLVESVARRRYPELPTCIGFCVYIKRELLDRIGLFDEERFGRGYGEENDFSCRAQAAGFADVLDDATFVFHKGKMSFGDELNQVRDQRLEALEGKHPGYSARVQAFVQARSLAEVHQPIFDEMLHRWEAGSTQRVLHLLHKSPMNAETVGPPGGVEYHVADLVSQVDGCAHWSLFAEEQSYCLRAHVPGAERTFRFAGAAPWETLLDRRLFDVVHLHHASRFDFPRLAKALHRHGRYYVALHDFALVCPRTNLVNRDGNLCDGHACVEACGQQAGEVRHLRATTAKILRGAQQVIHFSQSTRTHYARLVGDDYRWQLVPHGLHLDAMRRTPKAPEPPRPSAEHPLRVAFLGGIAAVKGAGLVRELVKKRCLPEGQPIEWHLIGLFDGRLSPHVVQHGRYDRADLPAIMARVAPHVVVIPSICPETYCFTLDEALCCGVPVIVTPRGAPAERVRAYQCGWVLDRLDVDTIYRSLARLADRWDEYRAVRRRLGELPLRDIRDAAADYRRLYHAACPQRQSGELSRVLAAAETLCRHNPHIVPWPRRVAGRAINRCLLILDRMGIRRLAARAVRHILPGRLKRALDHLRLAALVPAETSPPGP